ncbi:gpW family head-tail joining protein [Telmatospirillum sp. J64-1]|uniref:gpW family head-tail joining protein n=1 Tax=Telmatospirillum sp. J64-1 TaxID=2502183 RepID=UPI00115DE378|nr:gpW family head-tail joining protein [Telmatospirillum sp. J64-1]
MADDLQARIDRLEAALDAVLMGDRVESEAYDGRQVTYSKANVADLRARILELKARKRGRVSIQPRF